MSAVSMDWISRHVNYDLRLCVATGLYKNLISTKLVLRLIKIKYVELKITAYSLDSVDNIQVSNIKCL